MRIGDINVHVLDAGPISLDGGAMFGVVPRVLWEKKMPPDALNRIRMCMNVLLVQSAGVNLLLDTGAGDKEDERFRDQYGLEAPSLDAALASHGLVREDVHVVVNTHLHFDHAGGNTIRAASGRLLPAFPKARYFVQRTEFEEAMAAHERNRASYFPENYVPLAESGQMELVEGEREVAPGVWTYPLPGHTLGLQGLFMDSRHERGLYLTDCVPTSHHVPIPWIMAYDLYPMITLETKKRVLPEAEREGWTLFFEHDPAVRAAKLEETKPGHYRPVPVGP
jgi:glyoxylase-like metal-dependent hydrolase (beta-lactamase superfamily II)